MEQVKVYRPSLLTIGALFVAGVFLISIYIVALVYSPWQGLGSFLMLTVMLACLSTLSLGWSFHLWRNRKKGNGLYWDEEGILIDLKGVKVYWDEVESIQLNDGAYSLSKSTVIYPHYTYHEKIRKRRKKWMPTTFHSIEWFLIENPTEFHDRIMKVWGEKCQGLR